MRTYTEFNTQGGMFSHSGASNWILPKPNAVPPASFTRPLLCLKKVSLVADGKQMWTEPCMVKVQSQSPTSTPHQEYIFIQENKGVHLHLLQHIRSHSSVCMCAEGEKNDCCVCVWVWTPGMWLTPIPITKSWQLHMSGSNIPPLSTETPSHRTVHRIMILVSTCVCVCVYLCLSLHITPSAWAVRLICNLRLYSRNWKMRAKYMGDLSVFIIEIKR